MLGVFTPAELLDNRTMCNTLSLCYLICVDGMTSPETSTDLSFIPGAHLLTSEAYMA